MDRSSTDMLYSTLRASLSDANWFTYMSSIRQFLRGYINQAELSASLDRILSTNVLVHAHNQVIMALFFQASNSAEHSVRATNTISAVATVQYPDNHIAEAPAVNDNISRDGVDMDDTIMVEVGDGEPEGGDFEDPDSQAEDEDNNVEAMHQQPAGLQSQVTTAFHQPTVMHHPAIAPYPVAIPAAFHQPAVIHHPAAVPHPVAIPAAIPMPIPATVHQPATIISDGDATHQANHQNRDVPAPLTEVHKYIDKLQTKWLKDGGSRNQLITLPAGYRLVGVTRVDGSRTDYFLLGHPNHIEFRSYVNFFPHLKHLIRRANDPAYTGQCGCLNC